jgi:hypothetical protein
MSIRSADATIKGYFYQFNKTIEEILKLKSDKDTVTVEGIEDIDITSIDGTQSVQCKYYSSHSLTNSSIREPLILMLDHYRNSITSPPEKYTLYGYFKNQQAIEIRTITLEDIKSILTYKESKVEKKYHEEENIKDNVLAEFIKRFSIHTGKDFDEHRLDCIKLLRVFYKCTDFEAENYYYNNALRAVFDVAIQKKEAARTISKEEFLKRINCGNVLFWAWYKKHTSDEKYAALIKKGVSNLNLFSPTKDKMLYLGQGIDFTSVSMLLPAFIEALVNKYFLVGHVKYSSRPMTVVFNLSKPERLILKKELIQNQILFNDGQEEISFHPGIFCSDPIVNRASTGNGRIIKASFAIRIISKETFDVHYKDFEKSFSVLAVSEEEFNYPNFKFSQLLEVKYLSSLAEINSIL